jgi:GLPGLI family protein
MKIMILFILMSCTLFSQNEKTVYITYKTQRKVDPNLKIDVPKGLENELSKFNKAIEDTEFYLIIKDSISLFKQIEKLNLDEVNGLANMMNSASYFVNNQSQKKIKQVETLGQKFNIIYPFDEYKWEITSETKVINGYKCFKALSKKETFSLVRNRNIITRPEVWFTPEIPISHAPFGLSGLPGLILEATLNGKLYYYANLINLDFKDNSYKIELPNKGKEITERELEEMQLKSINEN